MAVLKAVIILLLFEPTIINGKALEYYSPASYQEMNPYETEWNYGITTNIMGVQCSEYKPKQNPCCPCPPNEPCCCEVCCNQCCEPYAKPNFKPHYKPSRQRYRRPLYDPWGESYCQTSLCPRIKKKKEEMDPSKFFSKILQLPITLVDGMLAKDQ